MISIRGISNSFTQFDKNQALKRSIFSISRLDASGISKSGGSINDSKNSDKVYYWV